MKERLQNKSNALNIKKGYKQTKLGLIPEEWETPTINESFEFLRNTSFSRNQLNYNNDSEVFYIHYGDIHSTYNDPILSFQNTNDIPRLNDNIQLNQNTSFLKNGDLIIADASEDYEGVGEAIEITNLSNKKVISGLHTFALRDKNNSTADGFRTYIFKNYSVKKALKTIATGSKVYGISKGNLQKLKIVLPPKPQQIKIAKILSTWDIAINKQTQLIKAKQKQKKALMQLLLTGKKRFDGFTEVWKEVRLGEVAEITTGSSNREDSTLEGTYTFFDRSEDIRRSSRFLFEGEAVIVAGEGQRFIPKYFVGKFDLHQRTYAIMNFNNIDSKFIYYYLLQFKNYLLSQAVGSTVKSLRLPMFIKMPITSPSFKEQKKIAQVLSKSDKEIALLKEQLAQLQQQKQGLMQVLLTGKVLVKV